MKYSYVCICIVQGYNLYPTFGFVGPDTVLEYIYLLLNYSTFEEFLPLFSVALCLQGIAGFLTCIYKIIIITCSVLIDIQES